MKWLALSALCLAICLATTTLVAGTEAVTFSELLERSLSGSPARPSSGARASAASASAPSSSYYSSHVSAKMSQALLRGCRVTGCLDCDADGGYFQSDFACANSEKPYKADGWFSGSNLNINKAAGCEWEFTWFKEFDGLNGYVPIEAAGSPYEQLGVVNGRCSFNSLSEECHGPLCEHMTLTMQGGVYATIAYSHQPFAPIVAAPGDVCEDLDFFNLGGLQRAGKMAELKQSICYINTLPEKAAGGNTTGAARRAAAKQAGAKAPLCDEKTGRCPSYSATFYMWSDVLCAVFNSPLYTRACQLFTGDGKCYNGSPSRSGAAPAPAPAAKVQSSRYDANGEELYGGIAIMFAGQTSVSTLKGGLKVEETGRLEYAPFFSALGPAQEEEVVGLPYVTPGGIQLWFREEEEKEHHRR